MKKQNKDALVAENCKSWGEFDEAICYYTKAIEKDFSDANLFIQRGFCKKELGDISGCMDDFDLALKADPLCYIVHVFKADLNSSLKNYEAAIENYNDLLKLKPELTHYYYSRGLLKEKTGDYQGAIIDMLLVNVTMCSDPALLFDRGRMLMMLNEKEAAFNSFDYVIRAEPRYAEAYYYRGLMNRRLNKSQDAYNDYSKVIELNPCFSDAYLLRGQLLMEEKHYYDAIDDFNKFSELQPADNCSKTLKGFCLLCLNKHYQAISVLYDVLYDDPCNVDAIRYLGMARLMQGEFDKGITDVIKSFELGSKLPKLEVHPHLKKKSEYIPPPDLFG